VLKRIFENRVLKRIFENRVLKRLFGPRSDEVTGEWRELRNEEINDDDNNDLYCSPNIVRVIHSKIRWAEYVACGRGEAYTGFW
jgi:hypothetical protein